MGIRERRETDKAQMKSLILRTAMSLFLKEGYDKLTIRRIAEEIEYSPATIYLYFRDKNDILNSLQSSGFELLFELQKSLHSIQNPLERLIERCAAYVRFGLDNPEFYDLMFIMRSPLKRLKSERQWTVGIMSLDLLKENINECMHMGYLPGADLDTAAFTVWSFTHGIVSLVIRERTYNFPEDKLQSIINGALDYMAEIMTAGQHGKLKTKRGNSSLPVK